MNTASVLPELRLRQDGFATVSDHVEGARPGLFNVAGEKKRIGNQRITGNRRMGQSELVDGQCGRQFARVPDLQTVRGEHHLDSGVACIIAVGYGIDDCFYNRVSLLDLFFTVEILVRIAGHIQRFGCELGGSARTLDREEDLVEKVEDGGSEIQCVSLLFLFEIISLGVALRDAAIGLLRGEKMASGLFYSPWPSCLP